MTRPDPAAVPLTNAEAAARAGIAPSTWRDYVAKGYAPRPDGRIGRTPWWWPATIDEWLPTRPGRGARTDLRTPPTEEQP